MTSVEMAEASPRGLLASRMHLIGSSEAMFDRAEALQHLLQCKSPLIYPMIFYSEAQAVAKRESRSLASVVLDLIRSARKRLPRLLLIAW
jgi:hypothetical protein